MEKGGRFEVKSVWFQTLPVRIRPPSETPTADLPTASQIYRPNQFIYAILHPRTLPILPLNLLQSILPSITRPTQTVRSQSLCATAIMATSSQTQRPLQGGCSCGRNKYIIQIPQNASEVPQIFFDHSHHHRMFFCRASSNSCSSRLPNNH